MERKKASKNKRQNTQKTERNDERQQTQKERTDDRHKARTNKQKTGMNNDGVETRQI